MNFLIVTLVFCLSATVYGDASAKSNPEAQVTNGLYISRSPVPSQGHDVQGASSKNYMYASKYGHGIPGQEVVYASIPLGYGLGLESALGLGGFGQNLALASSLNPLIVTDGLGLRLEDVLLGSVDGRLRPNLGHSNPIGLGNSIGFGQSLGLGSGIGLGQGLGFGSNIGLGQGLSFGSNIGLGQGLGLGNNIGLGPGLGLGNNIGLGQGFGLGNNIGLRQGQGLGFGNNIGLGQGLGFGSNIGLGLRPNIGLGQLGNTIGLDQTNDLVGYGISNRAMRRRLLEPYLLTGHDLNIQRVLRPRVVTPTLLYQPVDYLQPQTIEKKVIYSEPKVKNTFSYSTSLAGSDISPHDISPSGYNHGHQTVYHKAVPTLHKKVEIKTHPRPVYQSYDSHEHNRF